MMKDKKIIKIILLSILILGYSSKVDALIPVTYTCCINYSYSDGIQESNFEYKSPFSGTQLDNFENISNWTVGGTDASQMADTINFKEGSQGLKLIAKNGNRALTYKIINKDFSNTNNFALWIYIDDINTFAYAQLYFTSTNFSDKYFYKTVSTGYKNGWNRIVFDKRYFSNVGGESWNNTMKRVRIAIKPATGMNTNATVDDLRYDIENDWIGSFQEADTINFKEGSQGLKLIATNGSSVYSDFAINKNFSNVNNFAVWMYVNNASNIRSITMYLTSNQFNRYFYDKDYDVRTGWNKIVFNKHNFQNNFNESWNNVMTSIRLRIWAIEGQNANVTFDDLRNNMTGQKAVIMLEFDDGDYDLYSNAYPILNANNQTGVSYVIPKDVGKSSAFMNLTNLKTLQSTGWDISSHTYNHSDLTSLDDSALTAELNGSYDWLVANGFQKSSGFIAYPFGYFNDAVLDKVEKRYILGRSVAHEAAQQHLISDSAIRYTQRVISAQNSSTVQELKDQINDTINAKLLGVMMFHHIVDSNNPQQFEYSKTNFKVLSDYIKSRENDVDVMTNSEYVIANINKFTPVLNKTTRTYSNGSSVIISNNKYDEYMPNMTVKPWSDSIDINITAYNETGGLIKFNESSSKASLQVSYAIGDRIPNYIYSVKIYWKNGTKYQDFNVLSNDAGYISYSSEGFGDSRYQEIEPGQITAAPAITSWSNNKTNDASLNIMANVSEIIRFNTTANQGIDTWKWFKDNVDQNNNFDNFTTSFATAGIHTIKVNATNLNGTSSTVTWTITVQEPIGAAGAPNITSWSNNKTNDNTLSLIINTSESIQFNATANQTITTWNWYKDNVDQNNNYDNFSTSWDTSGTKEVKVNATNPNGTSNTIIWTVKVNPVPNASRLVANWKFDENTGTTAYDSSGNGNNGTVNGATWTAGKIGNALSFDGVNDYVDAGNKASLNITNAITIEAWVNPNNISGSSRVIARKSSVYYFEINSNGKLEAYFYGTTNPGYHQMTSTIPLNTWTHVAVTYDGSKVVLYKNDTSESFNDTGNLVSNTYNVQIGSSGGSSRLFSGLIDEVRIYNRSLSVSEVLADYNFDPPNTTPPTILSWSNNKTNDTSLDIMANVSETIQFNATANQGIDTWSWYQDDVNQNNNFDNSTTSFATAGIHTIKVNATNLNGTSSTVTWTVEVNEINPVPNVPAITSWGNNKTNNDSLTLTINTSEAVNFNVTANQTITMWNWYKDYINQNNNYDNFSISWDTSGTKEVKVNATNPNGTSSTIIWMVTVQEPIGAAGAPEITSWSNNKTNDNTLGLIINTSESIQFNATANQTITTWNWYQEGVNQNNNYDNFTAFWNTAGIKTVQVNATNSNGTSNTVTWIITVQEPIGAAGAPEITSWSNNKTNDNTLSLTINTSEPVQFNTTANQTITTWSWYQDDVDQNNNYDNFITSFTAAGIHTIKVNATNLNGTSSTVTWTVEVNEVNPVPNVPAITSWGNNITNNDSLTLIINTSESIQFNITTNQSIDIWNWYKDYINQNNNYDNFSTSWDTSGTKEVKVNATNPNGTSNTVIWTVTVQELAGAPVEPAITSWSNNKTNDASLNIVANVSEIIRFNATANQSIDTWNWFTDDVDQNNNYDNFITSFTAAGIHTIKMNATNLNGTSSTVTWTVTVQAQPEMYVPPPPTNINSTTGNFWVNTTWQLGAGNTTDSYNISVNSEWTNGTTNTSVNSPLSAHAWQNVTVYAYNASGSGSLSAIPAINNTQIPNNPPIQSPIGDKSVDEGQWLNFTVHATDADNDAITYGTNATGGSLNTTTSNFSWLTTYSDLGTYIWYFNSSDGYGGVASETIIITVNNTPLSIASFSPSSDPTTIQGTAQTFNITLNKIANITWYMNGLQVQTDTGTSSASYTNSTAETNTWNVTASATDGIDTVSRTWNWTVNAMPPITYIPPNPADLQKITGNSWVNNTWQAGLGNTTDSYNVSVNGTWYNSTTDAFKNSTTVPHGWVNITIWAYNSSGTGSLSAESISQNTEVANNPPIQDPIGNKAVTAGNWLNFTVSATDADSDPIMFGTNATKGNLNSTTGIYSWQINSDDAGTYVWYFNSSDSYGGIASEIITVTVNPASVVTYNISGYVFDNYGVPLEGVFVQNGSYKNTTVTFGQYLLTCLPNGTYNFSYFRTGFNTGYLEVIINGADRINQNNTIYDTTPPAQVTGLINDIPTQTTVNLTWNSIIDAHSYQVFRNNIYIGYTTNTYWNDTGLAPSTAYQYLVRANDSYNNWGINSSVLSVTTSALASGPVAYWKFDENTGTTAYDSSGNGNNGTISGANWTAGEIGTALSFNGVNDYVDAGNKASLNTVNAITVMAWVKLSGKSNFETIVDKNYNTAYAMWISSGKVRARVNATNVIEDTASVTALDTWYHVAFTYNGSNVRLYANGVNTKTIAKTGPIPISTNDLIIGASSSKSRYYFNGTIDEVKVYNRSLSASEVLADYNGG